MIAATATCDLCGLPAPAPVTAVVADADRRFCCSGCRQVYQILVESGQLSPGDDPSASPLYQQCLQMGLIARPGASFSESDLRAANAPDDSAWAQTREAAFQLGGMWCGACAWLIEHAIVQEKGVVSCRVLFAADVARIVYRPARTTPTEIAARIRSLGYAADMLQGEAGQSAAKTRERRASLFRVIIAGIFAMTAMVYQFALYYGQWNHIGWSGERMDALGAGIMSLPTLWAGLPIYRRAWAAARAGAATMETLVTLGAGMAFFFSAWALARGDVWHVYFDTAGMLIALILLGKYWESSAKGQATGAIALLHRLLPKKAVVVGPDGRETLTPAENLGVGNHVLVRPGERVPADGTVAFGTALVDESLLTGESRPVRKQSGDSVTGGTVAVDSALTVAVTRVGADTSVARMAALVESALAGKSRVERWADRVARRFVPTILLLAAATGAVLALTHHAPDVIMARVVAVLVIACPCALALATPLAVTSAVGAAAARGIVIADAGVLELLPRVRHLFLDKTGTLTEGRFAVRAVVPAPGADFAEDRLALAALESLSEHPLARALTAHFAGQVGEGRGGAPPVTDFCRIEGGGIAGTVGTRRWWIGNRALADQQGAIVPEPLAAQAREHEQAGLTVLYYGAGEHLRGLIALGDAVRPRAVETMRRLMDMGLTVELLSGDAAQTVEAVARAVGITHATAGILPHEKAGRVLAGQAAAFAGDGVNDAPALAQAAVGIAFGSGTEIARRAAAVTLIGDDIGRLADLFTLARAAARVLRQNILWACAYNTLCIPLAVLGFVNPIVAAGAMLISSLSVVLNSRRLRAQIGQNAP